MIIPEGTCKATVHLFIDALMPQHFALMNYRTNADSIETRTELVDQTEILRLPYRFFS